HPRRRPGDRDVATLAGTWLTLGGDAAFRNGARSLVRGLLRESARTFAIELRLGHPPATVFRGRAEAADALPVRAETAAIAGDRLLLLGGSARASLRDCDAMIAESASTGVPVVDSYFTGMCVACEVLPDGEGRCSADVSLDWLESADEPESRPVGSPQVPAV